MKRERVGPRGDGGRGAAVKEARKSLQLCRVVHETLALVLADEEVDPVLNEVMVSHVEPLAGDAQLLVTLVPAYVDGATPAPEAALVHAALAACGGMLREEVALAVPHRRSAPQLVYAYQRTPLPTP